MSGQPSVLLAREGSVARLTLNRPERLNALDPQLARELAEATATLADDNLVRVVIIEGAGGNFMAGGDIQFFAAALKDGGIGSDVFDDVHAAIESLRRMPQPVIAGIDGACAGFGISLVAACDLAVAADDAVFTLAYCHLGVSPDGGSSWFLPRILGLKRCAELMLLGDRYTAAEMAAMGLLNRVVTAAQRREQTQALAARLAMGAARAQRHSKQLLNESFENQLVAQLRAEQSAFLDCAASPDFAEGVAAFIDKRAPRFGG